MGSKRNWVRCRIERQKKTNAQIDFDSKRKRNKALASYRDGQFWIGAKLVERWDPNQVEHPGDGVFVNKYTARFEVWKDARKLSEITFKTPWETLRKWAACYEY